MKTPTKDRQSVLDIALQECGGMDALIEIAEKNDLSITDALDIGSVFKTPESVDKNVSRMYEAKQITPATDITAEDLELVPYGGIGYMGIEIDFIVS